MGKQCAKLHDQLVTELNLEKGRIMKAKTFTRNQLALAIRQAFDYPDCIDFCRLADKVFESPYGSDLTPPLPDYTMTT